MNDIVSILVLAAVVAVGLILVAGIVTMMRGGEFNRKYGNKLMRARLVLQAVAVGLVLVAWWIGSK
jgi:hypothetical protein